MFRVAFFNDLSLAIISTLTESWIFYVWVDTVYKMWEYLLVLDDFNLTHRRSAPAMRFCDLVLA